MKPIVYTRVALIVTNPQALRLGSLPRHHFSQAGGIIGTQGADWPLDDGHQGIKPSHCQIVWDDGAFCLVERNGDTRINGNQAPLGRDVSVRLNQGDRIRISSLCIDVHLEQEHHNLPDPERHLAEHTIEELLNAEHTDAGDLQNLPAPPGFDVSIPEPAEPSAALQTLMQPLEQISLDPLQALDAAQAQRAPQTPPISLDPKHYGLSEAPTPMDLASTRFEAISGSRSSSGEDRMSQHDTPSYESVSPAPLHSTSTLPAEPLLEGLGASVGNLDAAASYRLMLESGQTIRAFIQGLLALRNTTHGHQRLSLQSRTLQPIEDNPLHLGQSYEDTLRALFSTERSRVHLSPKAAVEESLAELSQHQHALLQGIEAGLSALLQAFSPAQLTQRFQRYDPDQTKAEQAGDWAWQMYNHYYNELKSDRQRGFEKLFWEVFEQHYDRALRAEA